MKLLRLVLFPFAILYGGITSLRNYFYNKGWWESRSYTIPVVCVGNLSTGGTGKSPMIQYLASFLQTDYDLAVLSRGYKRKTSGYREVLLSSTVEEVGDEALQFKQNFPDIRVAVCEDRREGIEKLQHHCNVILLDDAFQHRKVKPSTTILLTPFSDLFLEDYMLPTGNLREPRSGVKRADIIVVTKCPDGVAYAKLQEIQFRMGLLPHQRIYFSRIGYDSKIYSKTETLPLEHLLDKEFTLVTGIANPEPLVAYLKRREYRFTHEKFPDHHNFSSHSIKMLQKSELILTTEKDYTRLQPRLDKFAIYYLPIKTVILNEQEDFFRKAVISSIEKQRDA